MQGEKSTSSLIKDRECSIHIRDFLTPEMIRAIKKEE